MKNHQNLLLSVFALLVIFLFDSTLALGAGARTDWRGEWEKMQEAAKKEGRLNIYTSGSFGLIIADGFQKAYPEIKVVKVVGRGGASAQRILAEYRARKFIADVSVQGVNTNYNVLYRAKLLNPVKPALILPTVLDESKWWQGKHHYIDPQNEYVFSFVGAPQTGGIYYNTKVVNSDEFKSFWDFLNPKWKGKMAARDLRTSGPGASSMLFFYYSPKIGPKFIKRLFGEMELMVFSDFRQGVDWLAQGRFPICFFCARRDIARAIKQGFPIASFGRMKEGAGLSPRSGTLGLLKNAPHPNAAKLFANWALSREGQIALTNDPLDAPDSLRIDIPKGNVPVENQRMEGVNYLELHSLGDIRPVRRLVRETLAKRHAK